MTERTFRTYAKELAGKFYDQVRSAESMGEKVQLKRGARAYLTIDPKAFAKTYPTVKDYLIGRRHGRMQRNPDGTVFHIDDGSITVGTPGWMYWYALAREQLVSMLGRPDVHENIKRPIFEALQEDRRKQLELGERSSPKIPQRKVLEL